MPTTVRETLHEGPLRIITFNVLFDSKDASRPCSDNDIVLHHDDRQTFILQNLQRSDAHVICLNEVTPYFLQKLQDQHWVQERFVLSAICGASHFIGRHWGNVVLSSVPMVGLHAIPLAWNVDRKCDCIAASLDVAHAGQAVRFMIGSVHLHAFPLGTCVRRQQIRAICETYDSLGAQTGVILGDFNFFLDCEARGMPIGWDELPSTITAGLTWDLGRNRMLPNYKPCTAWLAQKMLSCCSRRARLSGELGFRLDRVIACSTTSEAIVDEERLAEIVFREPVPDHVDLFPSDHFGLAISLVVTPRQGQSTIDDAAQKPLLSPLLSQF